MKVIRSPGSPEMKRKRWALKNTENVDAGNEVDLEVRSRPKIYRSYTVVNEHFLVPGRRCGAACLQSMGTVVGRRRDGGMEVGPA